MRKKILSIILTTTMVLGLIPCMPCVKQVKAESSWKLVWSDEFDGDSLNTNVWTRETGGSDGGGWGNNELQYYTDRTENSYVSDGTLKIVAKRENYSNCRFTSARLKTAGKKSFKYGRMEARIKVNGGNQDGVWPAFWMMGDDGTSWPWCGELDIMEHANSRNYVEGTIHWNAGGSSYNTPYNHKYWGSYSVPAYYYYSDNNNGINGWHTYGVIWDENTIKWYVDNNIYLTAYLNDDNAYAFRKNHYFLLNLALGSNATGYTGNIAPNDSFQSATMEVDYVRAYSGSGELNPDGGSSKPDTDGYKSVPDNAVTTVGDCTLYAGNWDNGAISYKGSKLSDLSIKLNSTSGNAGTWGTQLKYPMNLVQGKKYNVTLKFNSTDAGNMYWKNEGENDSVDLGTVQYNVNAGINTKTLQITADSKNTAVMEMSGMPAGTVIDNISISSVQEADSATTERATTIEGEDNTIPAPIGLKYAGNKDLPYYFAWQAPSNDIESYNVYVNGTLVESTVATAINLKGEVFNSGSGDYIVSVKAVKNGKTSVATSISYTYGEGSVTETTKSQETVSPTAAPTEKATDAETTTEKVTETPTTHKVIDVDWSGVKYLEDGAEGGKLVNKYKAYCESDKVNIVNIQKNADGASVIYVTFPVAVSSTTAEEAKIEGAGVGFPVDSVKEGQNLFKVTLADNSTYDVYLYEEPVKVTTALPTTTQAPTTQTPTTVAPTEKATTVAPTTVAPTTKIDEDDTIPAPIGLTYAGNKDLPYYFAWQAPSSDIESYNVYVDGVFAGSTVNSSINLTADVFANGNGDYTVSVRSVKNGKMSAATQITYTFKDGTGSKPTTVAPVTTVAPTEKTTTVEPVTTQAPTTVAPTEKATTVVPTTQAPTTAAPTEKTTTVVPTTQAPTTAAPTEKATTVVPTTQAPTTAAPTEKATTAVPTTQAPTTVAPTTVAPTEKATTVVPTTQTPTTIAPSETGTTTKPETSKKTPTVSTTEIVTTKTAQTVKVPKVKIKKATKKRSAKKLKVTLKTAKGVKGYQVMISTSKKFKKAKVKNYKKAKFTIKKLKANKKYFIRVRAYKVVNGKVYYGKWSNRKVKFKK